MCRVFACRHWQDLGYLIIYITGRPDMQKQRVVSWLSQHNFPHGMIFFSEGLVHDPLRQKTIFLRNLVQEVLHWAVLSGFNWIFSLSCCSSHISLLQRAFFIQLHYFFETQTQYSHTMRSNLP